MTSDREIQRKRLMYRSKKRGNKEMDLILGAFVDRHLADFRAGMLDQYEALLDQPDRDLYDWITGRKAVPEVWDTVVMKLLRNFKFAT